MQQKERTLTSGNIDKLIDEFETSIAGLGSSIAGKTGLSLFEALKRDKLETGPYPGVTLFEAANRIMTDLVILRGVAWLLKNKPFPFDSYTVEFGNEGKNDFDIMASGADKTLVGEAFNVARALFQGKKSSMLKKLRRQGGRANYRVIMFNHDAVASDYASKEEEGLHYVIVNIRSGATRLVPDPSIQRTR
jgi:hypothetical protein